MKITIALIMAMFLTQTLLRAETINIIPTPKEIKVEDGRFFAGKDAPIIVLGDSPAPEAVIGAEEINRKLRELGAKEFPVKRAGQLTAEEKKGGLILVGTPEENRMLREMLAKEGADIAGLKPSGYVVIPHAAGKAYLLAGKDAQGSLYACVSFKRFLRHENEETSVLIARIRDWPDCKYRSVVVVDLKTNMPMNAAYARIDWCLDHKINFADITGYNFSENHLTVPDAKTAIWLRDLNEYASARGIETMYHCFWCNIGYIPEDKGKPEFNGCMESENAYWCWSRDELIRRKADAIVLFAKISGFKSILFHFRDGSPTEYWRDRCQKCRERFGDDRAGADANYINIMYKTIRSQAPGTRIIFVVEPYYGNLDIPENKPYREYFSRLTGLIPEDVYLVNADWDRESQDSWKKVIRQPVLQWRNLPMDLNHIGRDFSTEPALAVKSGYYPESKDISYPNCHLDPRGPGEIFLLQSVEFQWNVDAPGATMLHSDKSAKAERSAEDMYALPLKINGEDYDLWRWYKSSTEPKEVAFDLLPRLCEEAYGAEAAPMMAEIHRLGVTAKFVLYERRYWSDRYRDIFNNPETAKDQWGKAHKALDMLETFKRSGKKFKPGVGGKDLLGMFIGHMRRLSLAGKPHYYLLLAQQAIKEKKLDEARENIRLTEEAIQAAKRELPGDYEWGKNGRMANLTKEYEDTKFRLNIAAAAGARKDSGAIRVAIYDPTEKGGKVYGQTAIEVTLMEQKDIKPEIITSLKDISQYDCLIIPDCKKLGSDDEGSFLRIEKEIWKAEAAIRDYVLKDGKGVMLCHDSVGYARFAIGGRSIFPEIGGDANRKDADTLKITAAHPVTKGYAAGDIRKHMYWDHVVMKKGESGVVLATDEVGQPVVLAGTLGSGRVILNGTYTGRRDSPSAGDKTEGIDRDLLVNGVYWLAGRER